MVGPDSKPVSGEPVYVFAGDAQNVTLTTDAKGTAAFSFDTALWRDTVVLKVSRRAANTPPHRNPPIRPSVRYLQARSRKREEHEPYQHNLRRPEYRSASHHAATFYSRSRSFLKLMQVDGKLSCSQDASVSVQYIVQGEELKKGQEVLDCFYLVGSWRCSVHQPGPTPLTPFRLCVQVMSKGRVVQHGRVPVAVKAGSGKKSNL